MSSYTLAAVRLRHGAFCALASLSLLSSPLASASTLAISGTPATSVLGWHGYSFTPTVQRPSGATLKFAISRKPSWASFNTATGTLSGTPGTANVGSSSTIVISVSDGTASASLAPFIVRVLANVAPSISGAPATTASVGDIYTFTPKARETDGDPLSFSVKNKPDWASFSIATGTLSGTPVASNSGTYSDIVISASTGHGSAALAPFSITVPSSGSPGSAGAVTISWMPPTENVDGSALTNLAGYHIYYGTSQSSLTNEVNITNPGLAAYVLSNLKAATWYFAMTSVNATGGESSRTTVVSYTVE